jgi:hypothetical protein
MNLFRNQIISLKHDLMFRILLNLLLLYLNLYKIINYRINWFIILETLFETLQAIHEHIAAFRV